MWLIVGDEHWYLYTNITIITQYYKENVYINIGMGMIFHPGLPSSIGIDGVLNINKL